MSWMMAFLCLHWRQKRFLLIEIEWKRIYMTSYYFFVFVFIFFCFCLRLFFHHEQSIQAKLSFSSKEIVAISCAWCKSSYHNKESCFNSDRISEECLLGEYEFKNKFLVLCCCCSDDVFITKFWNISLVFGKYKCEMLYFSVFFFGIITGTHANIIVPPSWIIKLPRKGSFKSSLRKTPHKKAATKKKSKEKESKTFIIKPIPSTKVTPVLVFINPKSGGNQVSYIYIFSFLYLFICWKKENSFFLFSSHIFNGPTKKNIYMYIWHYLSSRLSFVIIVCCENEKRWKNISDRDKLTMLFLHFFFHFRLFIFFS